MPSVFLATTNMGWLATGLARNIPYWLSKYDLEWWPEPTNMRPLAYARNWFGRKFQESEREYFWLVDADTEPPREALGQMLDANVDVVAAVVNQMKRDKDGIVKPVQMLMRRNGADFYEAQDYGVKLVDRAGFGCVLFHRSVFENIEFPWFEERPWGKFRGTDYVLCEKLEAADIPIYGHFDIICGHRKEVVH